MAAERSTQGRMEMPTPFGPQEGAALKKLVRSKGQRELSKRWQRGWQRLSHFLVRHFLTKNPYDFLIEIS